MSNARARRVPSTPRKEWSAAWPVVSPSPPSSEPVSARLTTYQGAPSSTPAPQATRLAPRRRARRQGEHGGDEERQRERGAELRRQGEAERDAPDDELRPRAAGEEAPPRRGGTTRRRGRSGSPAPCSRTTGSVAKTRPPYMRPPGEEGRAGVRRARQRAGSPRARRTAGARRTARSAARSSPGRGRSRRPAGSRRAAGRFPRHVADRPCWSQRSARVSWYVSPSQSFGVVRNASSGEVDAGDGHSDCQGRTTGSASASSSQAGRRSTRPSHA